MKAALAFALLVACGGGGGKPKTPPGNGTGDAPPAAARDPWQSVTEGATFAFTSDLGAGGGDPIRLTATVARVESVDGARVIHLEWVENGRPLDTGGPPKTFTVTRDQVRFDDEGIAFPLARESHGADGLEVSVHDDGSVCYTDGPGEGAGDCPDVCFSDFCVDPDIGLVGGAGLWWPSYAPFQRSDL